MNQMSSMMAFSPSSKASPDRLMFGQGQQGLSYRPFLAVHPVLKFGIRLVKRIAKVLRMTELQKKLHLAQFPGWQEVLAQAQAHPNIQTEVGGIQILPKDAQGKYQKGMFFIDGIPVELAGKHPHQRELLGMHVWLNTQYLLKGDTQRFYAQGIEQRERWSLIRKLMVPVAPQAALEALERERNNWFFRGSKWLTDSVNEHSYDYEYYLDGLCKAVGRGEPALFQPEPDCFSANMFYTKDYENAETQGVGFDRAGGSSSVARVLQRHETELLQDQGYKRLGDCFHFIPAVPRVKHMVDKLVAEGKLEYDRDAFMRKTYPWWKLIKPTATSSESK